MNQTIKTTGLLDKTAISISALCVMHCLLVPVALILIPAFSVLPLADEKFHQLLIVLVLPVSVVALWMGCNKHRHWPVLVWGVAGLTVLVLTAAFGHDLLGEVFEKVATVVGALLLAIGHVQNYRQCQATDCEH